MPTKLQLCTLTNLRLLDPLKPRALKLGVHDGAHLGPGGRRLLRLLRGLLAFLEALVVLDDLVDAVPAVVERLPATAV